MRLPFLCLSQDDYALFSFVVEILVQKEDSSIPDYGPVPAIDARAACAASLTSPSES